jgi:hypothetical protein
MSALAIKEAVEGFFKGTVKPVLDKFIPDAEKRLEAENMIFTQVHAIGMGQIEINKEEAKSSKLFVAGWRPAVGWICACSAMTFSTGVCRWPVSSAANQFRCSPNPISLSLSNCYSVFSVWAVSALTRS